MSYQFHKRRVAVYALIQPANVAAFAFGPFNTVGELHRHCYAVPVSDPYAIVRGYDLPAGIEIVAPGDLSSLPHF